MPGILTDILFCRKISHITNNSAYLKLHQGLQKFLSAGCIVVASHTADRTEYDKKTYAGSIGCSDCTRIYQRTIIYHSHFRNEKLSLFLAVIFTDRIIIQTEPKVQKCPYSRITKEFLSFRQINRRDPFRYAQSIYQMVCLEEFILHMRVGVKIQNSGCDYNECGRTDRKTWEIFGWRYNGIS